MSDTPGSPLEGMTIIPSQYGVAETLDRLEASLKSRGVLIFARIDFAADAGRAGLTLHPEQLLLFGSPRGGTPLMVERASAGIDLPFKALCFEDALGAVFLGYNEPAYLVGRHGLNVTFVQNLAPLVALVRQAAA